MMIRLESHGSLIRERATRCRTDERARGIMIIFSDSFLCSLAAGCARTRESAAPACGPSERPHSRTSCARRPLTRLGSETQLRATPSSILAHFPNRRSIRALEFGRESAARIRSTRDSALVAPPQLGRWWPVGRHPPADSPPPLLPLSAPHLAAVELIMEAMHTSALPIMMRVLALFIDQMACSRRPTTSRRTMSEQNLISSPPNTTQQDRIAIHFG